MAVNIFGMAIIFRLVTIGKHSNIDGEKEPAVLATIRHGYPWQIAPLQDMQNCHQPTALSWISQFLSILFHYNMFLMTLRGALAATSLVSCAAKWFRPLSEMIRGVKHDRYRGFDERL